MILRRALPEEGCAEPGEAGREQEPALGCRGDGVIWAEQHQPGVFALCHWALPHGLCVTLG